MAKDVATKVVEAVDDLKGENDGLIHLSSGVVLRGKQAPPLALIKVLAHFPRPKPPVYFNETMGRDIENPDDPDYQERVRSYQTESSNAVLNTLILLGTELVEVPKKFPKPDDDAWLQEYNELGLGDAKPQNASWRYLTWMTFKAVLSEKDLELIRDAVGRLSGVPESAVQSAAEFPGGNHKSRRS
jgi:hypothetical protein